MTAASFLAALVPALVLANTTETARFDDFLNDIYQRDIHDSPMLAAAFGAKDGFDRWDDLSAAAEKARIGVIRAECAAPKRASITRNSMTAENCNTGFFCTKITYCSSATAGGIISTR